MKFNLASLATVALATQTVTADWLGKAGKSSNASVLAVRGCPQ